MRDIPKLEDVISSNLENGEKIVGVDIDRLTAPGENFGSIMLRIDISIKNLNTQEERILNTVGKFIPESEKVQEIFQTQITYRNEYHLYATIVPTLDRFLKSKGISTGVDFTAPFYGGRLNLDGGKLINSDAVILLKNLKTEGYTTGNKSEGFDFETSKVVLKSLAKFHAASMALRYHEPKTFEEKLTPYFYYFESTDDPMYGRIMDAIEEKLRSNGFSSKEIDAVNKLKHASSRITNVNDIWGAMVQLDAWTNNFLIKYENNKASHVVLVDFQACCYGTPLNDVTFFLFTSVQQNIFEESVDPLLEYYYEQLLDYLKKLEVDTQPLTKSSFDEEVKIAVGKYEFAHALWMFHPIMHEAMTSVDQEHDLSNWSEKHVQRILDLTRICSKKGWLAVK